LVKLIQLRYDDVQDLREQLLQEQNGDCPLCNRLVNAPVLDHHHTRRVGGSGRVRGVLCRACNVLLGKVENNCMRYNISQAELPNVLRRMALYLEKEQTVYLHPSEAPKNPKLMKSSYNELVKAIDGKRKVPGFPKSGSLTKELACLFAKYNIEPRFYA